MKIRYLLILPLVGLCPLEAFCQGNTERGAVIGGLGGALAGAAIGKHNHETAAGALLGGAVGLVAGSAIGNAQDRDESRRQAAYQQQLNYQYQAQQANRAAVSPQDVVALTQSGVDPQIIITQIRQNGVTQKLQVSDVIALHQQGVSEPVINAMQNAATPIIAVAPAPAYTRPVVVERYYTPAPYYGPYYYHHDYWHGHYDHFHHHDHGHIHAGVIIGN